MPACVRAQVLIYVTYVCIYLSLHMIWIFFIQICLFGNASSFFIEKSIFVIATQLEIVSEMQKHCTLEANEMV